MALWRGPDGVEVAAIVLNGRARFRVSHWAGENRYFTGDAFSVEDLRRLYGIDLADLDEVQQ